MPTFAPNPPIPGCHSSPNRVMNGDGFYVSYNDHDIGIYGCDTTALVLGQMQRFLILNGDHREPYAAIVDQGLNACLRYFDDNLDQANHRSDRLDDIPAELLPTPALEPGMC